MPAKSAWIAAASCSVFAAAAACPTCAGARPRAPSAACAQPGATIASSRKTATACTATCAPSAACAARLTGPVPPPPTTTAMAASDVGRPVPVASRPVTVRSVDRAAPVAARLATPLAAAPWTAPARVPWPRMRTAHRRWSACGTAVARALSACRGTRQWWRAPRCATRTARTASSAQSLDFAGPCEASASQAAMPGAPRRSAAARSAPVHWSAMAASPSARIAKSCLIVSNRVTVPASAGAAWRVQAQTASKAATAGRAVLVRRVRVPVSSPSTKTAALHPAARWQVIARPKTAFAWSRRAPTAN